MSKRDMPRLVGFKDNTGDPRMGDVIPVFRDPKPDPLSFRNSPPRGLEFDAPVDPGLEFDDSDPCGPMGFFERLFR